MIMGRVHARQKFVLYSWIRVRRGDGLAIKDTGRNKNVERLLQNIFLRTGDSD